MQPIVEVNDIEKSYGPKRVINHCSFKIYEGEIYVQVNFYPCIYVICKKS